MGWVNPGDYIDIDFGRFKDCRIVRAEDARGVVCDGIFIPFIQNYITKRKHSDIPHLMLKAFEVKNPGKNSNSTHILLPSCPKVMRDMLVERGFLDENAKQWSPIFGNIFKEH